MVTYNCQRAGRYLTREISSTMPVLLCHASSQILAYIISYFCTRLLYYII